MDVRERTLWTRMAMMRRIDRKMETVNAVRIGMADGKGYSEHMEALNYRRDVLELGEEEVSRRAFESSTKFVGGG